MRSTTSPRSSIAAPTSAGGEFRTSSRWRASPSSRRATIRTSRCLTFLPTINTHIPFLPVPPYQADWQRVLAPEPYPAEDVEASLAAVPDWEALGEPYADSLRLYVHVSRGLPARSPGGRRDARADRRPPAGSERGRRRSALGRARAHRHDARGHRRRAARRGVRRGCRARAAAAADRDVARAIRAVARHLRRAAAEASRVGARRHRRRPTARPCGKAAQQRAHAARRRAMRAGEPMLSPSDQL